MIHTEIEMILAAINTATGISYSNPKAGKYGNFSYYYKDDTGKEVRTTLKVEAESYERAALISEARYLALNGDIKKVRDVKFSIMFPTPEHTSYESFTDFVKKHKINNATIDLCFGTGYFKKNPHFNTSLVINRLSKYLGMTVKVKTVYPTNSSVEFKVVK
jgi:hypothetical protein